MSNESKPTPSNPAPQPPDELWGTYWPNEWRWSHDAYAARELRERSIPDDRETSEVPEIHNLAELYRQQGRESVLKLLKEWQDYIKLQLAAGCLMDVPTSYIPNEMQAFIAEMIEQVALGNSPLDESTPPRDQPMTQPPPSPPNHEHPPHYTALSPEPIDVIERWELEHHEACAVKYVARAKFKGDRIGDLKKAIVYLQRKVALLEGGEDAAETTSKQTAKLRIQLNQQ